MTAKVEKLNVPHTKENVLKSLLAKIIDKPCDGECKECTLMYTEDCSFLKAVRINTVSMMNFSSSR